MSQAVEETIEVEVPLSTAYNQWTQFEEFPRFMNGVESVQQLDDRRLHWVAKIAGKREEWDAEITAQTPDEGVAWVATEGKGNNGVVRFDPVARTARGSRCAWTGSPRASSRRPERRSDSTTVRSRPISSASRR